ncbi:Clavaminate synthase-like protein [Penicillium malachiteum]|uniref:Clavaminate synthase-like protein n=1 Tax=Penicillium malachiteum TaxID=1324776 RepID=UPI002547971B|nr:Clavaminate synthase-like protein [Penicillium malachiteum]KAJ5728547.1 Clavaminate synthase-like protein [Penicillium malachiteum]
MAVSSLDYHQFTSLDKTCRQQFTQELLSSFEVTGFAKLQNHPFSEQEVEDLLLWSHKFFDRPIELKGEISSKPGPQPMRGYTPLRVEEVSKLYSDTKIRSMTDSKEYFDQGPEHDTDFPNQWPEDPELSGFKPFMENFYRKCDEVCLQLIGALEIAWGIEDASLIARCIPSAAELRLTHYRETTVKEMQMGHTSRIAPHIDFAISDMIVNVGDTLTRWTNGRIAGGIYQVTIPEATKHDDNVITSRMSMAYPFKASRDIPVAPLPKFVTQTKPAVYPDTSALEFQRWRNSVIYNLDKKQYPSQPNNHKAIMEVEA